MLVRCNFPLPLSLPPHVSILCGFLNISLILISTPGWRAAFMSVKCLTQEQCTKHEVLGSPLELKMLASLGEGQTTSMMILTLWLASIFSSQHYPWLKHYSHENKGNDHQLKELLIVIQILLVSVLWKCIENSMHNMHTDVRVLRVKWNSVLFIALTDWKLKRTLLMRGKSFSSVLYGILCSFFMLDIFFLIFFLPD